MASKEQEIEEEDASELRFGKGKVMVLRNGVVHHYILQYSTLLTLCWCQR